MNPETIHERLINMAAGIVGACIYFDDAIRGKDYNAAANLRRCLDRLHPVDRLLPDIIAEIDAMRLDLEVEEDGIRDEGNVVAWEQRLLRAMEEGE